MAQSASVIKAVSDKADKTFDMSDPVVRYYFTHGKIRRKSVIIPPLKKDLKLDERISKDHHYHIGINDHERLRWKKSKIKTLEESPSRYVAMDRYANYFMTGDDLKRAKKGVADLRTKRRKQLYRALSLNLDERELRTLKNALLPAKAPNGQKKIYSDVRKKLGLNRRFHKNG